MADTYTSTTNKALKKPDNNSFTDHWNEPINQDWDIIDTAFGGTYTVSLTGSNVTLTQANCQNVAILLQGALTANVVVYFPSGISGFYFVRNNTTNSRTVTLASAGGSPGSTVTATQGIITLIWSDGSNIYAASSSSSLTAGSGISITGNTINVDYPLAAVYGGTGQATYTNGQLLIGNSLSGGLSAATLTAGANIVITNGNGTITIASTGGGSSGPVANPFAVQWVTSI